MSIALKLIGVWLFFDGILSLVVCSDKKVLYQAARTVRAVIGVALLFVGV